MSEQGLDGDSPSAAAASPPKAREATPRVQVPYMNAYGNITKALNGMKTAQTPPKFTTDFLSAKLDLSGGGARPVIPFLKKAGFLSSDGSPTERYSRFRNPASSGAAAAEGLKKAFSALYEVNEYAHDLDDKKLRGLVVQVTGLDEKAPTVSAIVNSFKALRAFADFDASEDAGPTDKGEAAHEDDGRRPRRRSSAIDSGIRLGYTINLNLPATSDVAVFNAIFKSLREHLLSED
jgi:hypothetical protein